MTPEQQVVSLELAKKLKELGVKQESLFKWFISPDGWKVVPQNESTGLLICPSAFTVAELGEMLPLTVQSNAYDEEGERLYYVCRLNVEGDWSKYIHMTDAPTEADARAKMLIYLIENNLITV